MTRSAFAALALALTAAPAAAEPFTLVIFEDADAFAARTDPARAQAYWDGYAAFGEALTAAGAMRGGGAVEGADSGRTVGAAGDRLSYSGHFVIEAADLDAATAWAERLPVARAGRVEVRRNIAMAPAGR